MITENTDEDHRFMAFQLFSDLRLILFSNEGLLILGYQMPEGLRPYGP